MDYFLNPTNLVQNNIQNKLISRLRVSITIIILFNFIELLYAEFPQIKKLAQAPVIPNLAISLSATTNIVRNQIIPINRKYPIEQLLQACNEFPLTARQRITFEYGLIDGVNDSYDDARRLIKLLARIKAKVNLLSLNKGKSGNLKSSSNDRIQCFRRILVEKGVPTYIRRPRGSDIFAACGQLHLARQENIFLALPS